MIISNTNTHITIQADKKDIAMFKRMMQLVQIRALMGDLEYDAIDVIKLSENIINQIKQQQQ